MTVRLWLAASTLVIATACSDEINPPASSLRTAANAPASGDASGVRVAPPVSPAAAGLPAPAPAQGLSPAAAAPVVGLPVAAALPPPALQPAGLPPLLGSIPGLPVVQAPVVQAPAVSLPNVVPFSIKLGTGNNPWNTAAHPVAVKAGQTVHITNNDSMSHRMHTFGFPCPHGDDIAPGESADCVVSTAIDTVAQPGLIYDHNAGPGAMFYLVATP